MDCAGQFRDDTLRVPLACLWGKISRQLTSRPMSALPTSSNSSRAMLSPEDGSKRSLYPEGVREGSGR
eukprot:8998992-Pyramimonas_sp.AAC.1